MSNRDISKSGSQNAIHESQLRIENRDKFESEWPAVAACKSSSGSRASSTSGSKTSKGSPTRGAVLNDAEIELGVPVASQRKSTSPLSPKSLRRQKQIASAPVAAASPRPGTSPLRNAPQNILPLSLSPSPPMSSQNNPLPLRRYQAWKGRNVFLCRGMCMLGVHADHLSVTAAMVVVTWLAFLGLLAPFTHITGCSVVAVIFLFTNLALLCCTAFTEPGIIPRRRDHFLTSSICAEIQQKLPQYCSICHIVRPARAKHCRHCDNCVSVFDHHCPWTGTCIGRRNYPQFLLFVLSVVLGAAYVLFWALFVLVGWISGLRSSSPWARGVALIAMLVWSVMLLVLVGALLVFHVFLICRGQTTSEFLRGVHMSTEHPRWDFVCFIVVPNSLLLPMWAKESDDDWELDLLTAEGTMSTLRNAL